MKPNIGIEESKRLEVAKGLSEVLADSYLLYIKTHKYHWNVTGPMFQTLHAMFEEQYQSLALAVDEIAERIRALGEMAPGSYSEFEKLATVEEDSGFPSSHQMIKNLLQSQEAVIRTARKTVGIAQEAGDEASVDLMVARLQYHEKTAWMLRSLLDD